MRIEEMQEWVEVLRRQSGVLVDYTAQYDGSGSRDGLENIKSTSRRVREAAEELQEWHR